MIAFKVSTSGLDSLIARYTNRANFLGTAGMQRVLQASANDLTRIFRATIDSMMPGSFRDLKEATKKQKAQQVGFVYPMLRRTSQLYRSISHTVVRPSGGSGWTIRTSFAGTHTGGQANAKIAAVHIEGQGRMPKRDFTKIPDSWKKALMQDIRNGLHAL